MGFYTILLIFISLCLVNIFALQEYPATKQVNAPTGPIIGHLDQHGTSYAYRGIRYGTSQRWQDSVFPQAWTEPFDAISDGPGCPQRCHLPPHTCPETYVEDCLFLNIFTSADPKISKRPVVLYIHGGNFKDGYGGGLLYNAQYISSQHIIFVSINYRLGALGFHYDTDMDITGNYGFKDQVLALQWIHANIEAFGGDPNRITITGQSAGAGSVATHLISPLSKGLFNAAWLLSNPFSIAFRNPDTKDGWIKAFRTHTKCDTNENIKDCLFNLELENLLDAQISTQTDGNAVLSDAFSAFLPWSPYIDGDVVPIQPYLGIKNGLCADVPIVLGFVDNEGLVFISQAFQKPTDNFSYLTLMTALFGLGRASEVTKKYPPIPDGQTVQDNRPTMTTIGTEYIFFCPALATAYNLLQQQQQSKRKHPVYIYHFDHIMSFGKEAWGESLQVCANDVCHAGELPFFFNSGEVLYQYTSYEKQLSYDFAGFFSNFVTFGSPNRGPSAIQSTWKPYSDNHNVVYVGDRKVPHLTNQYQWSHDICEFWDDIDYLVPKH